MILFLRGLLAPYITFGAESGPTISAGTGTPEGNIVAPIGSTYMRTDGGIGTALYTKESGVGNTGWIAHTSASSAILTVSDLVKFNSPLNTSFAAEATIPVVGATTDRLAIASFRRVAAEDILDELEMDTYTLMADVSSPGSVTVRITSQTCQIDPNIQFPIQVMVV